MAEATSAELQELSPLFSDEYYALVDIERVVAAKISPGGTAPERVAEQLALAQSILEGLRP
jgi:argininosuccinate lyase